VNVYRCPSCDERFYSGASSRHVRGCPLCDGRLVPDAAARPPYGREYPLVPLEPLPVARASPGSFVASGVTYPSVVEFVAGDRRRLRSRERDFGLRWMGPRSSSPWRAAWVEATGELYVVQSGDPQAGGGHVEVLALESELPAVERALAGWEDVCGEPGSLDWLRRRARLIGEPASYEPFIASA
jgi:hypothetical protein